MIYILVRNSWDYHHFTDIVTASTSLKKVLGEAALRYPKLPVFLKGSPAHTDFLKPCSREQDEHLTIEEFKE